MRKKRNSKSGFTLIEVLLVVATGRYPSSLQNLVTSDGSPNWNGPYLRGGIPTDAWGTPLTYTTGDGSYKIMSAGPDTNAGNEDDITSFEM